MEPLPSIDICSLCGAPMPCACVRELGFNPKARQRWRSKEFLKFVRGLPCSVPHCTRHNIEAAHFGPRGLGTKVHDCLAIPLCQEHHRDAHQSGRGWVYYESVMLWQNQTMAAALLAGVR